MSFKVLTSSLFDKEFKALCKKYPSAKSDVSAFIIEIIKNPVQGINLVIADSK